MTSHRWISIVIVAASGGLAGSAQVLRSEPSAGNVGAEVCATCHSQIHDTWKSGRHSQMLQPASPATVRGDFSKGAIVLRGSRYGLRVRDGQYFITESELTGKEQEHRIEYTLGSHRIQHYLTTLDKGRIVVLAPTWDVQRRQWFHNVEIIRPDEDDRQIVQQWNKNCVGCHVSGQDNGYDPATQTYHTRWTDFGTTCERCHGPGRAHVERYGRPTRNTQSQGFSESSPSSALIVRPTRLDASAGSAICAQCHSLRTVINPDYRAGAAYYEYFMPILEYVPFARHASTDPPYWADGRPRRFSNDAIGLWQSACFLSGGLTCTNCHRDPHLPNVDQNPQFAPANSQALCTRCHQQIGARAAEHTRHPAGSTGSACVECHMPKTVISIKATMRDHTISVPAPENTVRFGIPNACTECHTDKRAEWAADVLKSWWPDGRRRTLIAQAEAFTSARQGRLGAIDRLIAIAENGTSSPLIRANAVGYLGNYSDPRSVAALIRAAVADHPAVRATAMASLGRAGRGNAAVRAAVFNRLGDSERVVRIGALLAVINLGGPELSAVEREGFRRAGEEFIAWSRLNRQDADVQHAEGVIDLVNGDVDRAAEALQISVDLTGAGSSKFFLALARVGQRRVDEARALLREIQRSDPFYDRAQEQLKKLP